MDAPATNRLLAAENADGDDISRKWAADNQQWWDWYMSLAVNAEPAPQRLLPTPPWPDLARPSPSAHQEALDAPYDLAAEEIVRFQRDGYVKIEGLLDPAGLLSLRDDLSVMLTERVAGAADLGFPSLEMVWEHHEPTRAYVFSRRLARVAAELLGVDGVRLYHDNVLSKNPGCGRTPWHYDAHHYPIDHADVVTAWFPLQPLPVEMGPLVFALGMDVYKDIERLPFDKHGDNYDRTIMDYLREHEVPCDGAAYALGEVSFHHAFSMHSAGPNHYDTERMAIAITYFVDGARLLQAPTMISGDYEKFMPGVKPGDIIDSPLNPVLYARASDA
ncbi:MAG: phytanoyl-CoA dioxygenase family protein [Myxococcota bacterium]